MSINPAGILLLIVGCIAVIVGVRGTQQKVFDTLTGKPAGAQSPLGGTSGAVQGQGGTIQGGVYTPPNAPAVTTSPTTQGATIPPVVAGHSVGAF